MKQFIKKYLGEILTIIGTSLASYNVFDFSYKTSKGLPSASEMLEYKLISGAAYFYSQNTITLISIGFTLIVIGVLIIKNKK